MEVKVTDKTENPLLDRQEIGFEAKHTNAPTPSRSEVLEELSSELRTSKNLIVIEKLATPHGKQTASGIARIYESEDRLKEFEPQHLIKRTEISLEKSKEAAGSEEIVEEAEEGPELEEESAEERKTGGVEVEGPEPKEEIDYRDLSNRNISEIKERDEELDLDYRQLLEAEKENKNRTTLIDWIERKISSSEDK